MGFSQTLANLMKRAGHTPSTLAKCIVAEHPEMASPRKKFLSSSYSSLAMKLRDWCRNCVPNTHSDFKLILALEAKLSCPGVLQATLPHVMHAVTFDPDFAERDPI